MKHKLQTITLAILLLLPVSTVVVGPSASAANVFPVCNGTAATNTDVCQSVDPGKAGKNPVISALKVAITIIAIIIGVASVIVIIISGLTMITSNGDPQAIAKARGSIIYALVGLLVAALAQTIVAFVLNKL